MRTMSDPITGRLRPDVESRIRRIAAEAGNTAMMGSSVGYGLRLAPADCWWRRPLPRACAAGGAGRPGWGARS
jgi:hypothetical protein